MAILLAHSLWIDYKTPRQGLVVFNSFSSTPIVYYEGGKGYVWTPDDEETDSTTFARYYEGFLAHQSIGELEFITEDDTLRLDNAIIKPPVAHLMGRRFLVVGSGKWKQATTHHRLEVDDIIATKRFHGSAAKLQELYRFDRLIISGAMYEKGQLLNECGSLGITTIDLGTQGAMTLPPL